MGTVNERVALRPVIYNSNGPVINVSANSLELRRIIAMMFYKGEQGFFYDPFDLKTQYQNAAGATAVNATGQPLGLMLDKSKGLVLGPELLTNGDFSNGLVGWTANAPSFIRPNSVVDGKAELAVIANATGNAGIQVILNTTVGKWYVASCDVISHVDNSAFMWNETLRLGGAPVYGTGRSVLVFKATSSTTIIRCAVSLDNEVIGQKYYFDNASVKEISGNHAYQETTAARPIFRQKPILGSDIAQGKEWEGSSTNNLTEKLADGRYRLTTKSTTASRMGMLLPLEAGKTYSIELDVETTGLPINIVTFMANFSEIGRVHIAAIPANTRTVLKSTFTATDTSLRIGGSMANTPTDISFILGSVIVKEVTGYRTDRNYIEYDGVDDKLITNLPAQLNNCTVLRAIPDVGTQVKYNQTLPMLYEDSANHAGLVAINRALTRTEQLRLMDELDKRAGATSLETLTFKTFDNNQEGFVFDPNDLSTMFQDAAGTNPVTAAGQPVGLILDKKNPALVGGEVSVDITNWAVSGGINKVGKNTFSSQSAATGLFYDGAAIDGLKVVELHYTVTGGTVQICDALGVRVRAESTQPSGILKAVFFPDRSSSPLGRIYFRLPVAGATLVINKLIVHTYVGNHAYQTTSAARPILRQNAVTGANYLEFDGTDDRLTTNSFPAMGLATTIFAGSKANNSGTGALAARANAGYIYQTQAQVTVQSMGNSVTVPINGNTVITAKYAASGTGASLKVNNILKSNPLITDRGYNNNNPVVIGAFSLAGASPLSGHIYALIGIAKVVSDDESAAIEKEIAKRVGVTLNV